MNADALIILDSCETAAAVTSVQWESANGRTEVIAGSGYAGKTYCFAKHFIDALQCGSQLYDGITVSDLYSRILERAIQENHNVPKDFEPATPVHFSLGKSPAPSIVIRSQKQHPRAYSMRRPGLFRLRDHLELDREMDEIEGPGMRERYPRPAFPYPRSSRAGMHTKPKEKRLDRFGRAGKKRKL
jgi:hypothetical protein